jgi:hypothetical protein
MGHVSVEQIVSVIRYHPDGGGYGSPYTFSCLITRSGEYGWLSLATGVFSAKIYRGIYSELVKLGITRVRFERRIRGKRRTRTIT